MMTRILILFIALASLYGEIVAQTSYHEDRFILNDEYAFLGIYSDKISRDKARKLGFDNPYGSYVSSVIPGTAAERAGIRPLDYLYGIDEYRPGENQSFTQIIRKYRPGDDATVHLIRKGKKQQVSITFGSREDRGEIRAKEKCEEAFFGISAQSWNNQKITGIPVSIVNNSTAEAIGMQDGDIITALNGHKMIDWNDITIAIGDMEVGQSITVNFVRYNQKKQLSGRIKSYCETKEIEQEWEEKISSSPEPGDWFGRYFNDNSNEVDFSSISISVSDMDADDTRALRATKDIEIRTPSSLKVKDLTFSANSKHKKFKLSFDLPQQGPTMVKVFNESGRIIYNYDLGVYSGEFEDEIDIAQNGEGIYYLEVTQGNNTMVKKLRIK
jgi:hypothetical protein